MITSTTEVWKKQLKKLYNVHPFIKIRGRHVREVIGERNVLDMNQPYVDDPVRKVSDAFRYAEAYWILSGSNRVDEIEKFAPSIARFSDNGKVFQGAYGPKVTEQLHYVVETLLKDSASRQAVLTIWRENPRDSNDIPCTISLQFLIRDNTMHCVANMRSSDIWLGWVYDVFNFTCIADWVRLSVDPSLQRGQLTLNMGSSHLYLDNVPRAQQVLGDVSAPSSRFLPEFRNPTELMQWLMNERNYNYEG